MSQKCPDKMSEIDDHIAKRFDIKKRLGKGAYGIVWKAVDRKTGETVAVKKIFDAFRNRTDSQRTFREIMFLQSFRNHPNIIQLHGIHRAANNRDIYLGFEYMDIDLHVVIKRGNILKDCHKRYIMYQLLNATKYIHSGNVIHRDQKPSNVLLDQHCRCKIADFGLARSLTLQSLDATSGDAIDPTLTDYVATRWYRAPEILVACKRYTKGVDMWSLGCILGEMVAGKPVFPGTSTVNQVERIMATIDPPSLEDIGVVCSGIGTGMIKNAMSGKRVSFELILGNGFPPDSLDLINRLLAFNPNKRLTADQALEHNYVTPYRNKSVEITLARNIVPPLNDDVRLSIDDYRNKLYELMSHNTIPTRKLSRKTVKPSEVKKPEIVKIRSSQPVKTATIITQPMVQHQSETKFRYINAINTVGTKLAMKSDSTAKFPTTRVVNITSDSKAGKKLMVYPSAFNSYNHNHGIITASALQELKTGVR